CSTSFFFFQAEDGIRDFHVTGVQTCALPIWRHVDDGRNARGRHRFPLYGWSSRVQESCGKISRSHRRIANKKQPTTSRYRLTDPTPGQSSNRSICPKNTKTS